METRADRVVKWVCYSAVTLLALLLQGFVFNRVRIWGLIPFLLPVLAGMVSAFEPGRQGVVFCLILGVFSDWAVPAAIPCFYTVAFVLTALAAGLISTRLLNAGLLCSLAVTAAAFAITDLMEALLLTFRHSASIRDLALYSGREVLVALPFALLLHPAFAALHRRFHAND